MGARNFAIRLLARALRNLYFSRNSRSRPRAIYVLCESLFFSRLVESRVDFLRFARYGSHPILNMSKAQYWGKFWRILEEWADLLGNVPWTWVRVLAPRPRPPHTSRRIFWDLSQRRKLLLSCRISVATHSRRLRDTMERNRHGRGRSAPRIAS